MRSREYKLLQNINKKLRNLQKEKRNFVEVLSQEEIDQLLTSSEPESPKDKWFQEQYMNNEYKLVEKVSKKYENWAKKIDQFGSNIKWYIEKFARWIRYDLLMKKIFKIQKKSTKRAEKLYKKLKLNLKDNNANN